MDRSIPGPTALDVIDELEEVVVFHTRGGGRGCCSGVCGWLNASSSPPPPILLPPNPAWLCLGRIVDPDFALDFRTETVSSLMLLPQASLMTRALQTRAITTTALPPPNQTRLANRIFHQLSHVH
ncbi:hypothetical protein BASA81_006648 [Batrachochytrium salamandrivorans]|nr:hypothetical protein BASA81_006648 [Batrachochytrium salamandrivorans]